MSLARKSSFLFAALLALSSVSPLLAQQTVFLGAVLTPAGENPASTSTGFGTATFTIDSGRTTLTVDEFVSGVGTVAAAHIHKGTAGVAGPVVIAFTASNFVNGHLTQTIPGIDPVLLNDIIAHPDQYYTNVHNAANPNGAIRGVLTVTGGGTLLGGELRPSNEPAGNGANSTAVGAWTVFIDASHTSLTWDLNIGTLQNPTLAHIHKGVSGVNGMVVIPLVLSSSGFVGNRAHGVITAPNVDPVLLADIAANPSAYYVNVHTTQAPAGAMRGVMAVIDPTNELDVPVIGKVTTFVTDIRIFNPSFTNRATALLEYFSGASNTNATATLAEDIPPRGTIEIDDATGLNFLNSAGSTGGLRVTSQSHLVVTSRIFDDQRPNGKGTIGQSVNALSRANALTAGVIPEIASSNAFRTNVGFFNPTTNTVSVRLELRNNAGDLVGSNVIALGSYQQIQFSLVGLFPGVDLTNQPNLTLTFTASAPIDAYASIIDNTSLDPIAITAQSDTGVSIAP
jgi:CHRD domain